MTRRFLLSAAAALSLLGAPSALASPAVPLANGNDVILPDGNVYQLGDDGSYHLIPDVATANAMGLDWNDLQVVPSIDGQIGAPVADVAAASPTTNATTRAVAPTVPAANGDDVILPDGTVYQLGGDGLYHLVPDVATANAMGIDWNNLELLDGLDAPAGDPVASVV